jgi:hypothetical protein
MTDLDPLETPPAEGTELASRTARDLEADRPRRGMPTMEGPTGRQWTTESVGDPDRASVASGGEAGAGAGAMAGAAAAGPVGLPIGAAVGAAVGATAEAADEDTSRNDPQPGFAPGSEGTVVAAPGEAPTADRAEPDATIEEDPEAGSDRR